MEEMVMLTKEEYLMMTSVLLGSISSEDLVEQFGEDTVQRVAAKLGEELPKIENSDEVARDILVKAIDFLEE